MQDSNTAPDRTLLQSVLKHRKRRREVALMELGVDLKRAVIGDDEKKEQPALVGEGEEGSISLRDEGHKPKITTIVRNDYSQNFINTGYRPQNYIRDTSVVDRFEEYPKLRRLVTLKNDLVKHRATPPMYLKADLKTFDLQSLGSKFDVILIDPPLEEYCSWSHAPYTSGSPSSHTFWTWEEIASLRIEDVASNPSFIFVWVGSSEGLDKGRDLLARWGYRRCEDFTWIKTNKTWKGLKVQPNHAVLQHTKEHCLMGIKGTVRRSTDGHFIHCNVDTDVIIAEEPPDGGTRKPEELYYIIEHFCLGRRRLELFGEDHNIRPGWVTVGSNITSSNFDAKQYQRQINDTGGPLLGMLSEIETLRPKSPPAGKKGWR